MVRRIRLHRQPRAVTAHALREAVSGPPFAFAQRLGSSTCVLTLVVIFGPAMPLAWGLGVLYFAVALFTQRWALLRLHRLPDHDFDDRVLSRMIKWAKYIFLVHLIAVYATVRTLPCLSVGEISEGLQGRLGAERWLLPLIQQHGPWLSPEAFADPAPAPPGAPPAPPALPPALPLPLSPNASLPAGAPGDAAEIDRDAISLASLLALAAAAASLATVLMVCFCSTPITKVKRLFRRRKRDALKHVGQLARYSEGAQVITPTRTRTRTPTPTPTPTRTRTRTRIQALTLTSAPRSTLT